MATITRRTYLAKLPDGKTVRRKYAHYSIRYTDETGRRVWVKGYSDKGATQQLAAKLVAAVARGEQGMVDPFKRHKARPLGDHVKEWLADLASKGRDDVYRRNCRYRMTLMAAECGWAALGSVNSNSFMKWRDNARTHPRRNGTRKAADGGAVMSPRTLNQYRETAVAFLNWCVEHKRMDRNPLDRVAKVDGETVRNRRALTVDEVTRIITVAPAERRLAWETLLTTGLRVQEAADLQWQDVRLDNVTRPFLSLRMSKTKARRAQSLPLRADLAEKLRKHRPTHFSPAGHVFTVIPSLKRWKQDLKAAGVPYRDGADRQVDRHAMRTTLNTRLQQTGVSPRVAMEIMRHSDIKLTMKAYTDSTLLDVTGAVDNLPAINATEGTDDAPGTPGAISVSDGPMGGSTRRKPSKKQTRAG